MLGLLTLSFEWGKVKTLKRLPGITLNERVYTYLRVLHVSVVTNKYIWSWGQASLELSLLLYSLWCRLGNRPNELLWMVSFGVIGSTMCLCLASPSASSYRCWGKYSAMEWWKWMLWLSERVLWFSSSWFSSFICMVDRPRSSFYLVTLSFALLFSRSF